MTTTRWIEVRSYNLEPGTRAQLHAVMVNEALPLLRRWETDVVACGPSPHDETSYLLIRSYASVADRDARQDAFYGSDAWRQGPRARVLGFIESYTSVMFEVDAHTLAALRTRPGIAPLT